MSRYYDDDRYPRTTTTTETLAIGIEGDLDSFCGAIERFQHHKIQWNGFLTLKEQCARRIARLKNEQLRWFITAYLPPTLFQYVTKNIFNLRRDEFKSNYAKPLHMCKTCLIDSYHGSSSSECHCPNLEAAMDKLNKCFFKRLNKGNKTIQFKLIYQISNDYEDNFEYDEESPSFFLYLTPCESVKKFTTDDDDTDDYPFHTYQLMNTQVPAGVKLLFADIMRLFGGFQIKHDQPELILSRRREIVV